MSFLSHLQGRTFPAHKFRVEQGKIAEFARAVKTADPLHANSDAAAAAGLRGTLAPPTFSTASSFTMPPESFPGSAFDLRLVLAGGGEWEYLHPVVAGDELMVSSVVESVQEKVGSRGPMAVIRVRTGFERQGVLVLLYTSTILHFTPAEEMEEAV